MANAIVAQSVSRQSVAAALATARAECEQYQAWLNAINRAALNLEASPWQFDGDVLRIASASTPHVRYSVDGQGCPCKAGAAGRPCWHRAAWRLLRKAAELAALAAEIQEVEGVSLVDALRVAAVELGPLMQYARAWDGCPSLATPQAAADALYA